MPSTRKAKKPKSVYKSLIVPLEHSEKIAIQGIIALGYNPTAACDMLHIPRARYQKTIETDKSFYADCITHNTSNIGAARDKLLELGMGGNIRALEDWMLDASRRLPKEHPDRWRDPRFMEVDKDNTAEEQAAYLNKVFEHFCKMDGVQLPPGKTAMPADMGDLPDLEETETKNVPASQGDSKIPPQNCKRGV